MPLTNENYFNPENQMKYMGVSQFKAFEKCPASALAVEVKGEYVLPKSKALLVGSYIDAHFEGTLDIFQAQHPELFKRDGNLKSEYIQAEQIINYLENDDLFMEYMSGEKQVIMTGKIEDVDVKIKVDSLLPDKIVDLKIMRDFEPIYIPEKGRLNFIEAREYDLQGAVYQEIVRQNTGKKLPFFIAAGTKEADGPDKKIIEIPQSYLDVELERFKEKVTYFDAIKKGFIEPERCEHCTFCKATKVLTEPTNLEALEYE